ncbi:flagellar hook-length control protein FliK [Shewanella surugensis]|uniref:Flagellar hook-length control protein FliK n=1 Tax=Shewanella surugensis TaxID=212020 RepID=A0ABT0LGK9_9GAMM|nr:flagellar hook-length control protein FliK [Shewanella surugensis]MCL1126505.1 flagellar hook-length control protein FliK [Shewanella surugensis]
MIASLAITNTGSANTSARDVSIKSSPQFSDSMQSQDEIDTSSFELKDSRDLQDSQQLKDRQAESQSASQSKSQSTDNDNNAHDDPSHKADGSSVTDNSDPLIADDSSFAANGQKTPLTQAQQLAQIIQEGGVNNHKTQDTKVGSGFINKQYSQGIGQALTPQQAMTANLLQQGKHTGSSQGSDMSATALTSSSLAKGNELTLNNFNSANTSALTNPSQQQTNRFMPAGAFAFNSDNIESALSQLGQAGQNVVDEAAQLISQHGRSQTKVSQWGPISVSQSAPLAQQAQELLSPLKEQLRFQVDQQIKHAEVRLDPPELGKIELNIRLDGDKLHIHINAANTSVRDALQLSLDRLRDDLAMDHGGQIDLDISQGEHQQQRDNPSQVASIATPQGESVDTQSLQQQSLAQNQVDLLA